MSRARFWAGFGITDLCLLALVLIWGLNFVVVKRAIAEMQPLAFNSLRFIIASAILLAMLTHKGVFELPRRAFWQCLIIGAIGNGLYQIVFVEGIAHTSAGNTALILATSPIFIAFLSSIRGHERIDRLAWIGVSMSLFGVSLVIWRGSILVAQEDLAGDLLALAAAILWAVYTVGLRSLVVEFGSLRITAMSLSLGSIPLILAGLPSLVTQQWRGLSWMAWGGLGYSALGSIVLGYLVWNHGVRKIGGTRTAVYSNLTPLIALIFAWATIGETPRLTQLFGAALILTSIALTRRSHLPAPNLPRKSE